VSDGYFKDSAGAASFCTAVSPETGSYLQGRDTVQGPATSQSAYRSELSGILSIQRLATLLQNSTILLMAQLKQRAMGCLLFDNPFPWPGDSDKTSV
jgi:hypothetical protein